MPPKTKFKIFETIQIIILAAVILYGIFWAMDYRKFINLELSLAVQAEHIKTIQQTINDLEGRMIVIEGRNVLLIANTGREVMIETLDGQRLRCYFSE